MMICCSVVFLCCSVIFLCCSVIFLCCSVISFCSVVSLCCSVMFLAETGISGAEQKPLFLEKVGLYMLLCLTEKEEEILKNLNVPMKDPAFSTEIGTQSLTSCAMSLTCHSRSLNAEFSFARPFQLKHSINQHVI